MLLDRRTLIGSALALPFLSLPANASPVNREDLRRLRNAALLETSIREGTEDLSRRWYLDAIANPLTGVSRERSAHFRHDLASYLSLAMRENLIESWRVGYDLDRITVFLVFDGDNSMRDEDRDIRSFDMAWPFSTGHWKNFPHEEKGYMVDVGTILWTVMIL